ncbi:MAG: cytochrome c, partial [Caldimonas sp.]
MKLRTFVLILAGSMAIVGLACAAASGVGPSAPAADSAAIVASPNAAPAVAPPTPVERGRYLAQLGHCTACHTAPGGQPFAGGFPIDTGFGKIYTPNITSDRETGIGG